MGRISVAGLWVDALTKPQLLNVLDQRLATGEKTFLTTLYSEFLYAALRLRRTMELLNSADIAVPDGVAILWGQRFLSIPFKSSSYYGRIAEAIGQMVWTGAQILLNPRSVYGIFPEKIVGADLIWDIAELAARKQYSIYLLGGFGDTPERVKTALKKKHPTLQVVGASNKNPSDNSVIEDINFAKADIVLVAYGPLNQEAWIAKHKHELNATLFVGLGGTFDYVAGDRTAPPAVIRNLGLEWLYRLFTQPHRRVRIKNATWDLVWALVHYKVFMSLPLRRNAVMVIFNTRKQILVAKRNLDRVEATKYGNNPEVYKDHWQFPQGGLSDMEDFIQAAEREIKEELGTDKLNVIKLSNEPRSYEWNNALRPFFSDTYRNRGQEQRIVYFMFNGVDSDIKVDNVEFVGFKWVSSEQLIQTLHPDRRPLGEIVLADLNSGSVFETKANS